MASIFALNNPLVLFVMWLVSVNVALYFWYRKVRRKRRAEMLQRRIREASRSTRPFDLSPRDVAEIREMVEEAHRK